MSPPVLRLEPVAAVDLAGFDADRVEDGVATFARSCVPILARDPELPMGPVWAGRVRDWLEPCRAARALPAGDTAARNFVSTWLVPWHATRSDGEDGLVTGYYEPLLQGARVRDGRFRVPLHERPADLVAVDLGAFDPALDGRRISGRVEAGRLVPYPDRAAITAGALAGKGLELAWVDDPIAAFFMQVQGSGRVQLADGPTIRLGYADQNGRPYRAIGRDLVAMGALAAEDVSLQSIRDWLQAHPAEAESVMAKNPSYVFFRDLGPVEGEAGPPGAMGVPLTAGRSIAIDRQLVPLGLPVWLETDAPYPDGVRPLRRLVVAQDTGGAIRGPLRADLFWGSGPLAEYAAGHMKSRGRLFVLLPRGLTAEG